MVQKKGHTLYVHMYVYVNECKYFNIRIFYTNFIAYDDE